MLIPIVLIVSILAGTGVFFAVKRKKVNDSFAQYIPMIEAYQREYIDMRQSYICTSKADAFVLKYRTYYDELQLFKWLNGKNNAMRNEMCMSFSNFRESVPEFNKLFVQKEKIHCGDEFFCIDGKYLDDQQKNAVVIDEDSNLVVAGAGSGKTLTIAAKVKYLCERKQVKSEDILLIAFTRKAADEMTERIQALGYQVKAKTFHQLGLRIISRAKGKSSTVLDSDGFEAFLQNYFKEIAVEQPIIMEQLIRFFSYYFQIPKDWKKASNAGQVFEGEHGSDFETLKSKYAQKQQFGKIADSLAQNKRTLRGEQVKSLEELIIANFLFLHGVNYEYERKYPYDVSDSFHRQYLPDFYLTDYDIYLEHFGTDEQGNLPWLSEIEEEKYQKGMKWKREQHKKYGTRLLETYSWYHSKGILLTELEKILKQNGVKFREIDYLELYHQVFHKADEKCFKQFIKLCGTFITLFKSNGYKIEDIAQLKYPDDKFSNPYFKMRTTLFLTVIQSVIEAYEYKLHTEEKVDFSDMILSATDEIKKGFMVHPYRYVIIDEYQDISAARYKLIKSILEQTGAHLLCVGDDWQSVFRFSGSDLAYFTRFQEAFGASEIMRIEKTYRNSQQLVDAAADFIMKNPMQMKKTLKSDKSCARPIRFLFCGESPNEAITNAVNNIIKKWGNQKTILFLGRTNYDKDLLIASKLFSAKMERGNELLIYRKAPDVKISFMTVHKAKGLEADNVIILNFNNAMMGFPNKIADDPLLELVLSNDDSYLYAEERRLLYVALTRTRNEVYLIAKENASSEFERDFRGSPYVKSLYEKDSFKQRIIRCPYCETGHLVIRRSETSIRPFVGCTNFPQCTFSISNPNILKNPIRCSCGGFFVPRKGPYGTFLGCTNYPECTQTKQIAPQDFKGSGGK